MYAKIKNKQVIKYPYTYDDLKAENPHTIFSGNDLVDLFSKTNEGLAGHELVEVLEAKVDYNTMTQSIVEETPNLINGAWYQDWSIVELSADDIAVNKQMANEVAIDNRADAYRNESDPLFFKWQRGESTEQIWLDKVAEIKARFPKVE